MNSRPGVSAEDQLLIVIIQLIVIIVASRISGSLFRRLGQPQVCGEVAAGLILGPSLFGRFFPALFHQVFDPSTNQIFGTMSQLGLILMMFLIGLEFDFSHLNDNRRLALSVSVAGIVAPFGLGFALGAYMHPALGLAGSWLNFALFMATAMSITAIPTLGRIMIELNIHRTRLGTVTISAAAVNDAIGWVILALVSSIARSSFDPIRLAETLAGTLLFTALAAYAVRPLLIRFLHRSGRELSLSSFAALLIIILLAAAATNRIGIFSIFGPFILGAVLHDQLELIAAVRHRLQDFLTVFFLPIFFTLLIFNLLHLPLEIGICHVHGILLIIHVLAFIFLRFLLRQLCEIFVVADIFTDVFSPFTIAKTSASFELFCAVSAARTCV